jgi:penicillin-binding protein-related factor A (putative recombinase)
MAAKTKSTGAALEALVRKREKAYREEGLDLEQNSPRFAGKVDGQGRARGRLVAKGGLDFSGDYYGRRVTFDAKSTKGKSFPVDPKRTVKPHQARRLREAHERGAIAFLLVEFSELPDGPRYFALTWPVLAPYWEQADRARYLGGKSAPSIPLEVFKQTCAAVVKDRGGLDLIPLVAGLAEQTQNPATAVASRLAYQPLVDP